MSDFYTPPRLDHGASPGDPVRLRPIFVPRLPLATRAWQLLYISTNTGGDRIPVTALVIIPDATLDTVGPAVEGLLVYYPPFHGLGGRCAPSQLLAAGREPNIGAITAALEQGWVVAVADGEGLGVKASGPHTFLAARAAGQIVLDLARAARRIPALTTPMPVTAWGYGDGGRAVAAAGELAPLYAPELDLRGICAGAVVSDLAAMASANSTGPYAGLGLAGLIGLARAYPQLPLHDVLTDHGRRAVAHAASLTAAQLLHRYPQPLGHWCARVDPWNTPAWRQVLATETLAHTAPAAPLHLYHGYKDQVVPVGAGERTLLAYRAHGTTVTGRHYWADHTDTAREATSDVLARLAAYLTRAPSLDRAARQGLGRRPGWR
jgi:alpha-beta hydrolase superfamily lysophospholipase